LKDWCVPSFTQAKKPFTHGNWINTTPIHLLATGESHKVGADDNSVLLLKMKQLRMHVVFVLTSPGTYYLVGHVILKMKQHRMHGLRLDLPTISCI